ncbi:hypothetical protein EDB19DRAFT_1824585 [Suillus lakei]|nr:hypothetical protein EDB19DRAFT_1824585 [Suillus lakei]
MKLSILYRIRVMLEQEIEELLAVNVSIRSRATLGSPPLKFAEGSAHHIFLPLLSLRRIMLQRLKQRVNDMPLPGKSIFPAMGDDAWDWCNDVEDSCCRVDKDGLLARRNLCLLAVAMELYLFRADAGESLWVDAGRAEVEAAQKLYPPVDAEAYAD